MEHFEACRHCQSYTWSTLHLLLQPHINGTALFPSPRANNRPAVPLSNYQQPHLNPLHFVTHHSGSSPNTYNLKPGFTCCLPLNSPTPPQTCSTIHAEREGATRFPDWPILTTLLWESTPPLPLGASLQPITVPLHNLRKERELG